VIEPTDGWVATEVAEEFPGLDLAWVVVEAVPGPSTRESRERLQHLSSRMRGDHAVALRQLPIPRAYREFFRQVGLDPDTHRTPAEAAVLDRLLQGGFMSRNLVDDALTIALVETGVPLWALDAAMVDGPLGIRLAVAGETLGRRPSAPPLVPDRLVVADATAPLAVLFGDLAPGHGVRSATRSIAFFAVRVPGVPAVHVEEALWEATEALGPG